MYTKWLLGVVAAVGLFCTSFTASAHEHFGRWDRHAYHEPAVVRPYHYGQFVRPYGYGAPRYRIERAREVRAERLALRGREMRWSRR